MAIGAMKTFKSSGIRIPEDVSIVGFDDLYVSRFFHPALTTIRVDQFQMGELGASILLDILENEAHNPCRRIIATSLEDRESVRALTPMGNKSPKAR
jgi:DNA-binding LacI/PurR family transcriptional regulator